MNAETFCEHFATFSEAPNGVARLREMILQLAVQGQLVPQDENESAPLSSALFDVLDATSSDDDADPVRVPNGWMLVPVSQVCTHKSGDSKMIKGQLHDEPADGRFQGFSASGPDVWCDDWKHEGDAVIVSAVGARCGKTFKATGKWSAIANTHIVWPNPKFVSLDYLHLILNNERFWKRGGSAQPFVKTRETFLKKIGVPPLAEQRRIVGKVDQLLGLCDELAARQAARREARSALVGATLDRLVSARSAAEFPAHAHRLRDHFDRLFDTPTTIPQLRQAILQLAVQGQLVPQDPNDEPGPLQPHDAQDRKSAPVGVDDEPSTAWPFDVPISWRWLRLRDTPVSLKYGTSVKCDYEGNGVPVLRIPNVVGGRIDLEDLKYGELSDKEQSDLRLEKGDLLLIRSNGSTGIVGRTAVVDDNAVGFAYAGYLVRVRYPTATWFPEFLHLAMISQATRNQIEGPIRTTSGVKNINSTEIGRLMVPLPPLSEQKRIVSKVTELLSLCDALEAKLTQAESASTQLLSAAVHHLLATTSI